MAPPAVHDALDHFEAVDGSLDGPLAPSHGDAVVHGVEVPPQAVGESLPRRNASERGSIEPGVEGLHIVRMDRSGEVMGQGRTRREKWIGGHDLHQQGCLLSCAQILENHHYYRTMRLVEEIALAHVQGKWERLLSRLAKIDLLILDDFATAPLTAVQGCDLLEVVDDRAQRRSTIIASQLPVAKWHELIGDPTVADAVLDRLVHGACRFELRGESQRKLRSTPPVAAGQEQEP